MPDADNDPNKAVIIINRPYAVMAAWSNPTVFDNDKPIGEISNGGMLKWSRSEGTVKLDIWHETRGSHTFPNSEIHAKFDVKNNSVYKFSYGFGGILQPSSLKLEGDQSSKLYLTSVPPGAAVYAGTDLNNLKLTEIITPHTIEFQDRVTMWAPECYKMTLQGYNDSPVVCKSNSFGNRVVYHNFTCPTCPEPPLSELPIRQKNSPNVLIPPAIPE
ncbi:hypothetical protein [Geomonas limicola]|nr:hypothetical protein [Geomonas limicola]